MRHTTITARDLECLEHMRNVGQLVGDLMQVMCSGRQCASPVFTKDSAKVSDAFDAFVCKNYIALPEGSEKEATKVFGQAQLINSDSEVLIITPPISESDMKAKLAALSVKPISRIRIL